VVVAPFIAVGLPIMVLYGWFVPNPADPLALELQKREVSLLAATGWLYRRIFGRYKWGNSSVAHFAAKKPGGFGHLVSRLSRYPKKCSHQ
jgi:hypothetical protein